MKIVIVLTCILVLTGCGKGLSFDQMKAGEAYCKDRGLEPRHHEVLPNFAGEPAEYYKISCLDTRKQITYPVPKEVLETSKPIN